MSTVQTNTKKQTNNTGLGSELISLMKNNIRDYAMYIALCIIIVIFTICTNGTECDSPEIPEFVQGISETLTTYGKTYALAPTHSKRVLSKQESDSTMYSLA